MPEKVRYCLGLLCLFAIDGARPVPAVDGYQSHRDFGTHRGCLPVSMLVMTYEASDALTSMISENIPFLVYI
jgi:hypothetical protein